MKMSKNPKFYTKDYMSRPGMSFALDIADPAERMREFMNRYKNEPIAEVSMITSTASQNFGRS
jgi:hypothetical protein